MSAASIPAAEPAASWTAAGAPGSAAAAWERAASRPEHVCHQPERGADECGELLVGLVGMGEEPVERLQQRLVAQVEHLRYRAGQRIADQGLRVGDVIRLAGERRDDRAGRLERRIRLGELAVLLPDAEEPAVVGGLPVAPGALALLDDLADGGQRRLQVVDRDELRPAEQFRTRLGPLWPDEHRTLADPLGEGREALLDAAVQVPDRAEILAPGHDLIGLDRGARRRCRHESGGICALRAFRPLQVQEMGQRISAERQQRELHPARQVVAVTGEVRPAQRWCGADRSHHVEDQRKMQHLLDGDPGEHLVPSGDRIGLPGRQPLVRAGLEAEARVQVLAHDQVLDLCRLGEQVPQVLAMLDYDLGLGH